MLRARLSYANVMSTIATFVALGGTSYAVARNSVGTAQLKRDAVTSQKVKDRSLRTSDLTPATRVNLRGSRGLRGPAGPQGPPGSVASGALTPDAWQRLELIGGWTNYSPAYEGAGYRKDKQGQVHLRGLVSQGSGVPPNSTIIAVLPAGYRPAQRQILTTYGGNPDGATRVDILPDGALTWGVGPASETDYTSLSGLSYWPD
jgi:hypothetical protein